MKSNEAKKPMYIFTELGKEKLCKHCDEYWPTDSDAEWVNAGHELAEDRLRKLWIADQVLGGSGKTIGYEGAA